MPEFIIDAAVVPGQGSSAHSMLFCRWYPASECLSARPESAEPCPARMLSDVTDALQGARLVLPHQIESVGSHSTSRLLLAYVELSDTVLTIGEFP